MKKVIKQLPVNIVYSERIESWLNEMAKEGLILQGMGKYFAVFAKGEPQEKQYRIMNFHRDHFDEIVVDEYPKYKWTLVVEDVSLFGIGSSISKWKFYVFEANPEIQIENTMSVLKNQSGTEQKRIRYKKKYKTYLNNSKVLAVLAFLSLIFFYELYVFGTLLTIAALFLIFGLIKKKEKKRIDEYESAEIERKQSWDSGQFSNITRALVRFAFKAAIFIYAVLLAVSPVLFIKKTNLDSVNNFIRLEDVQQAYKAEVDPTYGGYIVSPFVPISYKADEMGVAKGEGENIALAEYNIEYGKTIVPYVPYLAYNACLQRSLKMTATKYSVKREIEHTTSEHFDKITFVGFSWFGDMIVDICMINETEFLHIKYKGNKTPQEIIDAVEKTLYE
ncbi:MAG: DUF2812 domain-containing protein [Eubacteriales bacterium]